MYNFYYKNVQFSHQMCKQDFWFVCFLFRCFLDHPVIWLGVHCGSDIAVWFNVLQPWSDFRWIALFRADPWQFLLILSNIGRTMMTTCFSLGSAVTVSFLQKWNRLSWKPTTVTVNFCQNYGKKYDIDVACLCIGSAASESWWCWSIYGFSTHTQHGLWTLVCWIDLHWQPFMLSAHNASHHHLSRPKSVLIEG